MEAGVDREFTPDFAIEDGEILETDHWQLEVIHTPGHCTNHVCYAYLDENSVFCGDHLMAWSTTVIIPPDGSVNDYLDSLERLKCRNETVYWPTHGDPIHQPDEHMEEVIRHRKRRIDQIHGVLKTADQEVSRIRATLYPDINANLHRAAEYSILASLDYLIAHRKVARLDEFTPSRYRAIN